MWDHLKLLYIERLTVSSFLFFSFLFFSFPFFSFLSPVNAMQPLALSWLEGLLLTCTVALYISVCMHSMLAHVDTYTSVFLCS